MWGLIKIVALILDTPLINKIKTNFEGDTLQKKECLLDGRSCKIKSHQNHKLHLYSVQVSLYHI